MGISNKTIAEQLSAIEEDSRAEDLALWGGVQGGFLRNDLTSSPAFREIITILHDTPLLVAPVLRWLKIKRAEMASAQLSVLYSPEELEEMKKSVQ